MGSLSMRQTDMHITLHCPRKKKMNPGVQLKLIIIGHLQSIFFTKVGF